MGLVKWWVLYDILIILTYSFNVVSNLSTEMVVRKDMTFVLADKTKEFDWQSFVFVHQRGEYDVTWKPAQGRARTERSVDRMRTEVRYSVGARHDWSKKLLHFERKFVCHLANL